MRWLSGMTIVVSGLSLGLWGCGSDSFGGAGQGTLQLVRVVNGAVNPVDQVASGAAQIDVCFTDCSAVSGGGGGQTTVEPFGQTLAAAVLINRGKSDIFLDTIEVSYPGSGIAGQNTNLAGGLVIPGMRCSDDATKSCSAAFECGGSPCVPQETTIPFTLFPLSRKELVGGESCNVTPFETELVRAFVSLSGRDANNETFGVTTGLGMELTEFNNCEA